MGRARVLSTAGVVATLSLSGTAWATGESVNGFPNWAERVVHQWMNRARVDPVTELSACPSGNCAEAACYSPVAPLLWNDNLGRAARFHASAMASQGFFAHDSACTLVTDIAAKYPSACDGAASCACVGGTKSCSSACTTWSQRIGLFGKAASGEIIATGSDPDGAFYLWLYEPTSSPTCAFSLENGHRWNILKKLGSVGTGMASSRAIGDFSSGGSAEKIPSGSHYPRQGASVEAWANWYHATPPNEAMINVDGACQPLSLARGTADNGAYKATLAGLQSGCHRYYFRFRDAQSAEVTYPTTGSLGIGPEGSCADWDSSRPPLGAGCGCTPQCGANVCGDNGCGGSCGTCGASMECAAGQCVTKAPPADAGTVDGGPRSDAGARDAAARDAAGTMDATTQSDAAGGTDRADAAVTESGTPNGSTSPGDNPSSGCSCRVAPRHGPSLGLFVLALALTRRRARRSTFR